MGLPRKLSKLADGGTLVFLSLGGSLESLARCRGSELKKVWIVVYYLLCLFKCSSGIKCVVPVLPIGMIVGLFVGSTTPLPARA